jgi:serine/threonine-protein kinase
MQEGSVLAGKYRLISLLGRGGMGSVWRAQHLDLDAPVAVKLIDPAIATSGEGLARFHREAQAAATLRSPHVVQILDRGVDGVTGQPFIVMELMEGESLASRLARQGRLTPELTARIVSHIARALGRAHEAGIVHRDLKPDNVFLIHNEDEDIAKVLDFGIAKSDRHRLDQDSQTRTGAVMGTPYYMSPEQISGSKGVDLRTDLWALGVIACECLTGRRPFDAETIGGLALKICAEPLPRPTTLAPVPPAFDAWFERAASREPSARFQSAREASDELRRALGVAAPAGAGEAAPNAAPGEQRQAFTTGAVVRTVPGPEPVAIPKRSVVPWLFVAGLGLAGLGAGALWFFRSGAENDSPEPAGTASAAIPAGQPERAEAKPLEVAPTPVTAPAPAPAVRSEPAAEPNASASAEPKQAARHATPPPPKQRTAAAPAPAQQEPASRPSAKAKEEARPTSIGSALDQRR